MDDETRASAPGGRPRPPARIARSRLESLLLRVLTRVERALLYVVAFILLAIAGGVVVMMFVTAIQTPASWGDTAIALLEELLLVLIVIEIFVTVQTHLEGGHLQVEPFIIIGVIAVVRHILSVVVRLSVTMTPEQTREEFTELAAYAGVTFVLVAALALARWSKRASRPGS
ncbi:phosphate-starvation-inducible PsiE family protein [Microtetraspora sp. AC03309]|uniref:phosphate-starvation-inducible PsiE family protein n=1 Tax=Microtetraspora sp. AC03309 TaxID=2779376 RepID=UPI001E315145|nr:phosphate-starvation-inducible PsiE family protein [Microtetraspora sp. AC03309]MCC5578766.1 phosphate-starvation-inducible PsiE family protein [Microtetraspora sp. AC03309]